MKGTAQIGLWIFEQTIVVSSIGFFYYSKKYYTFPEVTSVSAGVLWSSSSVYTFPFYICAMYHHNHTSQIPSEEGIILPDCCLDLLLGDMIFMRIFWPLFTLGFITPKGNWLQLWDVHNPYPNIQVTRIVRKSILDLLRSQIPFIFIFYVPFTT